MHTTHDGAAKMERPAIARRIRQLSRLTGSFVLRSGRQSDTYFDKYMFESDPILLRAIAEVMAHLVPGDTEVLCGLELGGIPVVTVLSQVTGLPSAFIRKQPKTHGTCKYAEGPSLGGKVILLVEDIVSSGGAIIDAATMLRDDDLAVSAAVCVIDRQSGGREALQQHEVELDSLFTMQEIEVLK